MRTSKRKASPVKQRRLFAFSRSPDGKPEYAGVVVNETAETVRISCLDALMLWFGVAAESGQVEDVPRERVRLFDSRDAMLRDLRSALREVGL